MAQGQENQMILTEDLALKNVRSFFYKSFCARFMGKEKNNDPMGKYCKRTVQRCSGNGSPQGVVHVSDRRASHLAGSEEGL